MRRFKWCHLFKLVLLSIMVPFFAAAGPDMSRTEVAEIIRKNSQLNEEQINKLIDELVAGLGAQPGPRIPIRGVLFTHGMNGALLVDTDDWYLDATIVDPATGQLVEFKDLFSVRFHNGGIKAELAYKWMFTFVPSDTTVHQLDGAVYGRGLGGTMEAFLGLEGAWMPGENRPGHLFHVAVKAGFGGGLNFPKMEFRLRRIR